MRGYGHSRIAAAQAGDRDALDALLRRHELDRASDKMSDPSQSAKERMLQRI